MANIALMGWDLLHGNLVLHGWVMSDVSFYPTELVQYALLESVLGLHMTTAHVAAAMTYTLVVLLTVLLARAGTTGREAVARTLIAGGIMVAPQLSTGVYAVDLAVGHIGTSVPLLLGWLLLDRGGRRWQVPALLAVVLGWVLVADPIVEITGIGPLFLVAGARLGRGLAHRRPDWFDAALAGAAVAGYALAAGAQAGLHALGGYQVRPLPVQFRTLSELPAALPALWKVLDLYGADFNGQHSRVSLVLALVHLVSVALVLAALGRVVWPGGRLARPVALTDRVLAVGIAANLLLFLVTMASTEGAHEIAVVLPYSAALAGRLLAPALLTREAPARVRRAWVRRARLRPSGHARPAPGTRGGLALAGLVLLAGYLAGLGYELTAPAAPPANAALAAWLEAHHLRSGLASYWEASSVTVDSGGQVRVRAVTGSLAPYRWMTNLNWYGGALSHPSFLILEQPSPGELRSLRGRFGPPAGSYQVDGCTVLVLRSSGR